MKIEEIQEDHFERAALRSARLRWVALVIVSLAVFLDATDVSIVNVALPALKLDLRLTTTELQWVPGAYILTYAGFMLLGGRAADLFGRRRVFTLGVLLFGLASLAGGLAHSGWLLILARGGQGIGAALTMPSATSILTTTFPEGPERHKALGIFIATGGAGFACGLTLGGVLTTFINWHWIFFVNVPVAVLILMLARVAVREERGVSEGASFDLVGAFTITAALLLLVFAMTQANQDGMTPLMTAGLFALALLLLGCFLLIEWRTSAPLVPLRVFHSGSLGAVCGVTFLMMGTFFSFLFISTLYLQNILRVTPLEASLAFLPAALAAIPSSQFLAPFLIDRFGTRFTASLAMLGLLSASLLLLRTDLTNTYLGTILPASLLAMPCGMALCLPTMAVAAVSGIRSSEQGVASGLQGMSGQIGGGLFLAFTATMIALSTSNPASGAAQLYGLHIGLMIIACSAGLGLLLALLGIRSAKHPQ